MPAHLFILYFSILSMVTPPVALSAYAAAGISGANLWNTGLYAFLLAVPGFLVPYAFAMNPALLLLGETSESVPVVASALVGVIMLAAAIGGYIFGPLAMPLRIILFAAAPMLIIPDLVTDLIGAVGIIAILGYQIWRQRIAKPSPASGASGA